MSISKSIAFVLSHYRYDLPESADDTMHNITADIADEFHKIDPDFDCEQFMRQAT